MIISKTPLRISFVGGGTDNLVNQNFEGNIVATSINKYVYLNLNNKFDKKIRFSYSRTENVNSVQNIKHEMLRETFRYFKINNSIEISSIADVPSYGSGLGSSSSFLVGLINCINSYKNLNLTKKKIAEIACRIEINILNKPIGMQDQYIAAYGGLNWINFKSKKKILISKIKINKKRIENFNENLCMIYTNQLRKSETVLKKVKKKKNFKALKKLSSLALDFKYELEQGSLDNLGEILNEGWQIKKELSNNTSNDKLDEIYNMGLKYGAKGGKLLGAGGGGFMLFYIKKELLKNFKIKFAKFKIINFKFSTEGTKIFKI